MFPVNLNTNHWVVINVDLEAKQIHLGTFSHPPWIQQILTSQWHYLGDSLFYKTRFQELEDVFSGLQKWLAQVSSSTFMDMANTLPIGEQKDTVSCRVCVMNAMERTVFGTTLFIQGRRHTLHIWYFVELVDYLLENMGLLFSVSLLWLYSHHPPQSS